MDEGRWRDVLAHRERLLRIATARCASREDAEDVVHDAMLRCVEFEDLDPDRTGAFLTSVTLRLCVDVHRRRERGDRAVRRLDPPPDVVDPEELACRAGEVYRLRDLLRKLPVSQRRVVLDRANGLTMPQIAKRHGLTYKATESALSRARATLRAALVWSALVAAGRRLRDASFVTLPATAAALAVATILAPPSGGTESHVVVPEAGSRLPGRDPGVVPSLPGLVREGDAGRDTGELSGSADPGDRDPILGSAPVTYEPPPDGEPHNLYSCTQHTSLDLTVSVDPYAERPVKVGGDGHRCGT